MSVTATSLVLRVVQLGNAFHEQKYARCRQPIQSDPAFDDVLWYHRVCLEEGTRALQRAHELAARFGVPPAFTRDSQERGGTACAAVRSA